MLTVFMGSDRICACFSSQSLTRHLISSAYHFMHFLVFFLRVLPAPFLAPEPYFRALSWRKSSSVYLQCSPCQALISLELISLRSPAGTGTRELPGNPAGLSHGRGSARMRAWNRQNKSQAAGPGDLIPNRSHLISVCKGRALLCSTQPPHGPPQLTPDIPALCPRENPLWTPCAARLSSLSVS